MNTNLEDLERAHRMLETLSELYHINRDIPIIVEGKRDVRALRELGFHGEIRTLNTGKGLYEFCEEILGQFTAVVLLLDWDAKGEALFKQLSSNLSGLWETYAHIRESLKLQCQKEIKDIESIPSLLYNLLGTKPSLEEFEANEKLKGNR